MGKVRQAVRIPNPVSPGMKYGPRAESMGMEIKPRIKAMEPDNGSLLYLKFL